MDTTTIIVSRHKIGGCLMSQSNKPQDRNNQQQDKNRQPKPGQAGGDQMPAKDKNSDNPDLN